MAKSSIRSAVPTLFEGVIAASKDRELVAGSTELVWRARLLDVRFGERPAHERASSALSGLARVKDCGLFLPQVDCGLYTAVRWRRYAVNSDSDEFAAAVHEAVRLLERAIRASAQRS